MHKVIRILKTIEANPLTKALAPTLLDNVVIPMLQAYSKKLKKEAKTK